MKRGFSATTYVLVAVLIGALFLVGRTVTPPPPGPPEPPPAQKANAQMVATKGGPSAADRAKAMQEMMKKKQEEMKKHPPTQFKGKKFDPNQIEIAPGWTHERIQGEAGNEIMAKKVAEAKAAEAAARASGHGPAVTPAALPVK